MAASCNIQGSSAADGDLFCCLPQVPFEPGSLPSVSVVSDSPASWSGDLLAVAVTEDDLSSSGASWKQFLLMYVEADAQSKP
jgi:hypothetical protein